MCGGLTFEEEIGPVAAAFLVLGVWFSGLRNGLDGGDKVDRLDDKVLAVRLRTRRPEVLAVSGVAGIVLLVLLMVVRPGLW